MIVKHCKKHGALTQDEIYVCGNRRECRACMKERTSAWRKRNIEKYHEYDNRRYQKNKEKRNKHAQAWKDKTGYAKKKTKEDVDNLKDHYVRKIILETSPNLSKDDLTEDLMNAKRAIIKLRRAIREKKNDNQEL